MSVVGCSVLLGKLIYGVMNSFVMRYTTHPKLTNDDTIISLGCFFANFLSAETRDSVSLVGSTSRLKKRMLNTAAKPNNNTEKTGTVGNAQTAQIASARHARK